MEYLIEKRKAAMVDSTFDDFTPKFVWQQCLGYHNGGE